MPICERDPWRQQYFDGVACPDDVVVPVDDLDCHAWLTAHRWVYEKLRIAKSQGLACGGPEDMPQQFPVFAKPNINLRGMGLASRIIRIQSEFDGLPPGHMWMPYFDGAHISTDCAIVDGQVCWQRHALGLPTRDGMFSHWVIETGQRIDLESYLSSWVEAHMPDYTGMMNFETIGGRIIEAHLRFADQWPDLYGEGWVEAVVGLYARAGWAYPAEQRREGYSVPLFVRHGPLPPHPRSDLQDKVRGMPDVSSLQITYHEERADEAHPQPPGGFRLALINCWDLQAGLRAREVLATGFAGCELLVEERV